MSSSRRGWQSPSSVLLSLAVFELAFTLAYRFAMSFTATAAAPLWFPDAVVLCALLANPPRRWWMYLLAPLPVRLLVAVAPGTPAWFLLATYANDSLKALLAAAILWRTLRNPARFESLRDFRLFAGAAVLLAPALSAFGGAATRQALGSPFWPAWQQWFLGDALANLVLTPAILYWFLAGDWWRRAPARRIAEAAALALGLIGVGYVAFNGRLAHPYDLLVMFYAPVPFLLWAALRFEIRGASGALCLISSFAVEAASSHRGPYFGPYPELSLLSLQLFVMVIGLSILFLAVMVGERDRDAVTLHAAEERYREVVNTQTDLVCRYLPDTTLTFVNDAVCRYFGRSRGDLLGRGSSSISSRRARARPRAARWPR